MLPRNSFQVVDSPNTFQAGVGEGAIGTTCKPKACARRFRLATTLTDGVSELKIDFGPGYRVYYAQRGDRLLLLLVGGDKSTQQKDIERAIALARGFQE